MKITEKIKRTLMKRLPVSNGRYERDMLRVINVLQAANEYTAVLRNDLFMIAKRMEMEKAQEIKEETQEQPKNGKKDVMYI